jgi:hypothetical protein
MSTPSPFDNSVQMTAAQQDSEIDEEGVESENKGEGDAIKPWDPKQIRITTKNFTVREVYTQISTEELDLAPDFQRSFVWDDRQQIRLIESILLGIPLPAFYFNQDTQGSFQVIDGVQRLTTIKMFMSNILPLKSMHLEYLKDFQNRTYDTLEPPIRRRFAATQIVAHVIEPQTPDEVKYDIFNRVNTGGSPLTPQEIRHCMSKARSRELLRSLVERESFDRATANAFWSKDLGGHLIRDNRRMANREMALRFCAFRSTSISEYERASSLDGFLLEFTRSIDRGDVSKEAQEALEHAFQRSMVNCSTILSIGAFRRWPPEAARRGPINRAIFESQALAMADYELSDLLPFKAQIAAAFRALFEDSSYDTAVRSGTGDPRRVERRLAATRECLARIFE